MGKQEKTQPSQSHTPRFSRLEIRQMEKLLHEGKDDILDEKFHQKLADEFNRAPGRAGVRAIQMKQVQRWFGSRYANNAADAVKDVVAVSDSSLSNNALENSSDLSNAGEKIPEPGEYDFEAKSSRDEAWYDVGTFLAYRLNSGEPEVRVKYEGFGSDDDEWVDVKKAIRLRSIPLESSECQRVAVGDLVLCFRETNEQACYFDAHVRDIQRRVHDIRGCRCLFSVQYDRDQTEERVSLKRLCRRP